MNLFLFLYVWVQTYSRILIAKMMLLVLFNQTYRPNLNFWHQGVRQLTWRNYSECCINLVKLVKTVSMTITKAKKRHSLCHWIDRNSVSDTTKRWCYSSLNRTALQQFNSTPLETTTQQQQSRKKKKKHYQNTKLQDHSKCRHKNPLNIRVRSDQVSKLSSTKKSNVMQWAFSHCVLNKDLSEQDCTTNTEKEWLQLSDL